MKIIGLTGGIASGKSTVATILSKLGAIIIDADKVSRKVVMPGEPAYAEIRKVFGDQVFLQDGNINRKLLGQIIFNDHEKRNMLNIITHPRIIAEFNKMIAQYEKKGHEAIVLEVPLLLETGMDKIVDEVWLVAVDEKTQIQRIGKRDGLTKAEALQIMATQMPTRDKMEKANIIIDGNQDYGDLYAYLVTLWNSILKNR